MTIFFISSNLCTCSPLISFPFSSLFFTTTTTTTTPSSFALLLQTRLHTTTSTYLPTLSLKAISSNTLLLNATSTQCKYVYPDPVPEFAQTESLKFRSELTKKLWTNKEFGDDLDKVVSVCEEIFKDFLHKEYAGPGTLLVEPFTDMLVALKENKLPGAPEAARAALLWAQNYLDKDWEIWISQTPQ